MNQTRAAEAFTDWLSPQVVAIVLPMFAGVVSAGLPGLGWGAAAAVTSAVVPAGAVEIGVRAGWFTGRHLPERRERLIALAFTLAAMAATWFWLKAAGGPVAVTAAVAAMYVTLTAVTAVNIWWKLSGHASVGACAVTIAVMLAGPVALAALPLLAAVCWSRLHLGAHTGGQVAAGLVTGTVVAAGMWQLIA